MEGYCRGCLKEFEPTELLQYSESNRRLFVYCTGLQVKRNDAFTFQLCKECFIYLKIACKFKKQCRNSDQKFKTYLGLKNAGECIDFRTYMNNSEGTLTLRLPKAIRGSTPLYQKNYDDDDIESTCTSIQNFMTDIQETLQEEDVLTTEDNIIREVIQEEADISDDSLDSHWLEEDEVHDFGMDFNYSLIGTPISSNQDRCNTPVRITADEEDTCHYVHKDVILKSEKTITVKNKKGKVNDIEKNNIIQPNAKFSDDNFAESNELIKTSIQNDMPLLDDCDIALDEMLDANVSMPELENEFSIVSGKQINNAPISNKEITTEQANHSLFTTKLEIFANKDCIKLGNESSETGIFIVNDDTKVSTIINDQIISIKQYNNSSTPYPDKSIQDDEPKVDNELEQYIAKMKNKKRGNELEKCAIDKNLEIALKNDCKKMFPLEQLLNSPQVSDQYSGGSTPIVHNILFGTLTPMGNDIPEHAETIEDIIQTNTEFQINQSPKVNVIAKVEDNEEKNTVRIFKGCIKSERKLKESNKVSRYRNRGYKDITRLKSLQREEHMFEENNENNDSSDETDRVTKDFNKSENAMSVDDNLSLIKDQIGQQNSKDKVLQAHVTDDLDISITNLLDFDENQTVDLNISIASDFLEEEQKESMPDQAEITNDHVNDDEGVINENKVGETEIYDFKDKKVDDDCEEDEQPDINEEEITSTDKKEVEQSENVFKKPLPPPDQYDLGRCICKICKKKYKNVRAMKVHFAKFHNMFLPRSERKNVPQICEICGKALSDMVSYKRHLKIHNGSAKCKICSLPFKSAGTVRIHMRSHKPENINKQPDTEQKKYLCVVCDKEFKTSSNFNVHMRRHDKNYTHKCQYCNKGFVRNYDLQQHIIVQHTLDLPFACELCPKKFKSRYLLVGHMYVHMGIKKFACKYCDKQFETNQHLKQHNKTCLPMEAEIEMME